MKTTTLNSVQLFCTKMDLKILVLLFLLCVILQSSNGSGTLNDSTSRTSRRSKRIRSSEIVIPDSEFTEAEQTLFPVCSNCKKSRWFPNSIADKINFLEGRTSHHQNRTHTSRTIAVPKESERIAFSQRYNPGSGTENDGFVPVPGPYGTRSGRLRENTFKSPVGNLHKSSPLISTRRPSKRSHNKSYHTSRQASRIKHPQSVQRRAQYRHPKITDELTMKESLSNENLLGNGNFEIIKGGIFSDQDANEILGSRRISGGFGSYIVPKYRQTQNRFTSSQNVQFPPFYQGHIQHPINSMFYPRAPF